MSQTQYRASSYTESSVPTTVWGPGTLAGRAILALGEATLKGLDRIVDRETRAIQKRFGVIRAVAPQLTPEMYSDLVELARPDLYPQHILETATEILFQQMDLGYGAAVALSIAQLTLSEAQLVVFRMYTSRDCDLSDDPEYPRAVRVTSPQKALDLLVYLIQVQPELTPVCFEVLDHLNRNPRKCLGLLRFRNHPIIRIHAENGLHIPQMCRTPLSELQLQFSQDRMCRWKSWRLLENAGHSLESHLLHINDVLLEAIAEHMYATTDFVDAAVDLFEVLLYSRVPQPHGTAADLLTMYISLSRDSWEPLAAVLNFVTLPKLPSRHKPWHISPSLGKRLRLGSISRPPTQTTLAESATSGSGTLLAQFLCHAERRLSNRYLQRSPEPWLLFGYAV
ncbi:hypothetical protein B0H15DRAFT_806501 [Mycena belliarum]|uniref:Uncharacterized protein n=1 Tax=Mycena belliarum TaxID=1033014 RepID=A0AAD6XH75_9AGAR|nr:hypothetical protein B0H15DRAFT_806501 [Mycena belliae]